MGRPLERRTCLQGAAISKRGVTYHRFGTLPDGSVVDRFVISNGAIEMQALTYGGIITSLRVPDRDGQIADVVLGHDSLEGYLPNKPYLGALVGRCANRIAHGRFQLNGDCHQLATNDGPNHLHGGDRGFDQHLWAAAPFDDGEDLGVKFTRTSPAGEEHYPGTVDVSVTYRVTVSSTVVIQYEYVSDAPTIVNLTQHSYFNLTGQSSTSALDHQLLIHAGNYTPIDRQLIPTGEIASVEGTAFDFRRAATIEKRLQHGDEQLRRGLGFDHNFVLSGARGRLCLAADLFDPTTGRLLRVATTEPGLQFYSGQLLDGLVRGAYGRVLGRHAGLCLETQRFPDAPNHPIFPPITRDPGRVYGSTTSWQFIADGRDAWSKPGA